MKMCSEISEFIQDYRRINRSM